MKLTVAQLRRIIKEEVMKEGLGDWFSSLVGNKSGDWDSKLDPEQQAGGRVGSFGDEGVKVRAERDKYLKDWRKRAQQSLLYTIPFEAPSEPVESEKERVKKWLEAKGIKGIDTSTLAIGSGGTPVTGEGNYWYVEQNTNLKGLVDFYTEVGSKKSIPVYNREELAGFDRIKQDDPTDPAKACFVWNWKKDAGKAGKNESFNRFDRRASQLRESARRR